MLGVSAALYWRLPSRRRETLEEAPLEEEGMLSVTALTEALMGQLKERCPEAEVRRLEARRFAARLEDGPEVTADVGRLLLSLEAHPDKANAIKREYVTGLLEALGQGQALGWDEAKWRVVPTLCGQDQPQAPGAVRFEFEHGLEVGVALLGPARREVTDKDVGTWAVSRESIRQAALENLERLTTPGLLQEIHDEGAGVLYIYESRDGLDAARLLLEERWRALSERCSGPLLIAVPSQDFLIAFTQDNEEHAQHIQSRVFDDWMNDGPRRLTWKLFEATPEGIFPRETMLH